MHNLQNSIFKGADNSIEIIFVIFVRERAGSPKELALSCKTDLLFNSLD